MEPLNAGQILHLGPDTIYGCQYGTLLLKVGPQSLGLVRAQQPICLTQLPHRPILVEALVPSALQVLPNADLPRPWLAGLWARVEQTEHLLALNHCPCPNERLYLLLNHLWIYHGEPCLEGRALPFPLTQNHFGQLLGLTRVTINRLLKPYRPYLTTNRERIILHPLPPRPLRAP